MFAFLAFRFNAALSRLQQQSTFAKARQIIKSDGYGMMGINRGLTATLGRHGVWNMVYFGVFHSYKGYLPQTEVGMGLSSLLLCSTGGRSAAEQ